MEFWIDFGDDVKGMIFVEMRVIVFVFVKYIIEELKLMGYRVVLFIGSKLSDSSEGVLIFCYLF